MCLKALTHASSNTDQHTSIAKLKSFHQNHSVQPEEEQQTKQGGDQHSENGSNKTDNCVVEEEYILKPVPETSALG